MPIAEIVRHNLENASWIRKMFETGILLKQRYGADQVYDFSLGNPDLESPAEFNRALREEAAKTAPFRHGYMPNAGYPETRRAIAEMLTTESGLGFSQDQIIMTCGAAGAINTVLKSLLNPGDEVIIMPPYFVEYEFYIGNHEGKKVEARTTTEFLPDPERIAQAITPKTRVLLINTPNNPSGRVYSAETFRQLATVLEQKSREIGHPVYLLADEPYKKIIYDGHSYHSPFRFYANTIMANSFSKDLSLAGERIGFLAVSPRAEDVQLIIGAATFCNRVLGFINAPALMQHIIPHCLNASVDISAYRRRRDLLYAALTKTGYDVIKPEGTFYMFPKCPIPDDIEFVLALQEERILTTPGSAFHYPGYFRISYTVDDRIVEAALPGFEKVFRTFKQKNQ